MPQLESIEPAPPEPSRKTPPAEVSSGRETGSGLELHSLAPPPNQTGEETNLRPRLVEELEVREVAKFGVPEPGLVGTLKYWLLVHRRLRELRQDHATATDANKAATDHQFSLQSELGRKAHQLGIGRASIEPVISRAQIADAELKSTQNRQSNLQTSYQAKLEPLHNKRKQLETEAAPTVREKEDILKEKETLDTDRKRIEAKKKRVDIQVRNLDGLIAKRREACEAPNLPSEQRDTLLREVQELEDKKPALNDKLRGFKEEDDELALPLSAVELRLVEIQEKLTLKQDEINAVTQEIDRISAALNAESNEMTRKMEDESNEAKTAWATVGQMVVSKKYEHPDIDPMRSEVVKAMANAAQTQRKVELLEMAMVSYDEATVSKAKKMAAIAGASLLGIIILLIAFI